MNILLISYGDYRYDGRLRELIKIFNKIGKLTVMCIGKANENNIHIIKNLGYYEFIKHVIYEGKKLKNIDILVVDNRRACIPGLRLIKYLKPAIVIQDCRELYLSKESHGLKSKVGCYFEQKMLTIADIIIAANKQRSDIMKDIYNLSECPIVYENFRHLEYINSTEEECANILGKYIKNDEFRIISTSGCNFDRTNNILVENLNKVKAKVRLFLVGNSSKRDIKGIKNIIKRKKLNNVEIIGNLQQAELKYLISHSHIGIVNYHQKDINNKFCASGKIYEYLYEGIPVVTTTNPPLKSLCDKFKIGVSTDLYYDGINEILQNYKEYKTNVKKFMETYVEKANNDRFIDDLTARIKDITVN